MNESVNEQWAPPSPAERSGGSKCSYPVMETNYPSFWRTQTWQVWRPIVALVVGVFIFFVLSMIASVAGLLIDQATGRQKITEITSMADFEMTPIMFLATNLSLAALVPTAMLIGRIIFGQKGGFVSSVIGKLRWGWLGVCVAIMIPVWALMILVSWLVNPAQFDGLHANNETVLFICIILLTTPLQCAGEEYGFRGLINRSVSSFVRPDKKIFGVPTGMLLGTLVSSLMFMAAHAATDIWLNLFYFMFGVVSCIMAWRTGGLEASIAMHAVNNLVAMTTLPFGDTEGLFDRSSGVADASALIQIAAPIVGMLLVLFVAKKLGVQKTSAPDAPSEEPDTASVMPKQIAPRFPEEGTDEEMSKPRRAINNQTEQSIE